MVRTLGGLLMRSLLMLVQSSRAPWRPASPIGDQGSIRRTRLLGFLSLPLPLLVATVSFFVLPNATRV